MSDRISQQDLNKMKETTKKGGVPKMLEFIHENLQEWKSVPLRVALVGESAVGKSSFINTIRGLFADDEGGAAVGPGDTTQEPTPYPHPDNANIVFWDLPGVGTPKFPRGEYLSKIGLSKYDFFLVFSAERFTKSDVWLTQEIRKQKKDYFCVRTKIDDALDNAKWDRGQNFDENQVIQDIKKSCVENLQVDMTRVYVVDNYDKDGWDFPRLLDDILASLPEQQRQALLLTLGPLTKQVIKMKADALRRRVWIVATAAAVVSGASSAIPLAGAAVSAVLDIGVLAEEVVFYVKQFGLNHEALNHTAEQHKIPLECLAQILQTATLSITPKAIGTIARIIISEATEAAVTQSARLVISIVVPVVSAVISGALSFASAVYTLRSLIEKLQEDAERVADRLVAHRVMGETAHLVTSSTQHSIKE